MSDNYDGGLLFKPAFPTWIQESSSLSSRLWMLVLERTPSAGWKEAIAQLGVPGLETSGSLDPDGVTLRVRAATTLNPMDDEVFYGAAYSMLRAIDQKIGRIRTIQGQPRNRWQPFRGPNRSI